MEYRNLQVWKQSIELTKQVYELLKNLPPEERYAIADQMRRAAVSIPSNIAEGCGRQTKKDVQHFLYIARGSVCEIDTQLEICKEVGYIDEIQTKKLLNLTDHIHRMLTRLIDNLYVE
jgi:four helix bundle protein